MLYCYTYKCKLSYDMLSESDDMLSVESNVLEICPRGNNKMVIIILQMQII